MRIEIAVCLTAVILLMSCKSQPPTPDEAPLANGTVVTVTAKAGPVDGTTQNSDEFIWRLFAQFAAPAAGTDPALVTFETWASDADTFSATPSWPGPNAAKQFQASVLGAHTSNSPGTIDVPCNTPPNGAIANFPTVGPPKPCIAEEVRRNRPQFDYIVNNQLNTKAGLAVAYQNAFTVAMPLAALSIKGDWVPVQTVLQWIPQIGDLETLRTLYYTYTDSSTSGTIEYALVAIHVSSRQNSNWVWGSFEHQLTPGRCDDIGCFDTFGAAVPAVRPNQTAANSQYGVCEKTTTLQTLMSDAGLSSVWQNYCLKSTQVDYVAADGTPTALGNSVIERITGNGTIAASSCIACHVYASFTANGSPSPAALAMLPYNPTGQPIPGVLQGSLKFDFMWGVVNAP